MITPRFAISTRSDPLMSLAGWRQVCANTGINDLDLDYSNRLRRRMLLRGFDGSVDPSFSSHSVWLGKSAVLSKALWNETHSLAIVPEHLVLPRRGGDSFPGRLDAIRRQLGGSVDLAMALKPENREGSRAHLDRISNVRRIVEEWDLSFALDLSGSIDPRWEAEAAVLRMGNRLRLVRLTLPEEDIQGSFYARPADQLVFRVLATLKDMNYNGTISLKLRMPWWNLSDPVAAANEAIRDASTILTKFRDLPAESRRPPRRVF